MQIRGSDLQDWFIILLVAQVWIASTVYLFMHPELPLFVAWSGLCTTMGGIYHWLSIRDDKAEDKR